MTGEEYLKEVHQFCMGDQEESMVLAAFKAGQSHPSEETASKIWEAAKEFQYGTGAYDKNPYPDFETFYKQLIDQQ